MCSQISWNHQIVLVSNMSIYTLFNDKEPIIRKFCGGTNSLSCGDTEMIIAKTMSSLSLGEHYRLKQKSGRYAATEYKNGRLMSVRKTEIPGLVLPSFSSKSFQNGNHQAFPVRHTPALFLYIMYQYDNHFTASSTDTNKNNLPQ